MKLRHPKPPAGPGRRRLIASAASSGLALMAAPAVLQLVRPARAASSALVGAIKPTVRVKSDTDILAFLPAGIKILPVGIGFDKGTKQEFSAGIPAYERQVANLAGQHCNLISAEGAPVFMILGPQQEAALTTHWQNAYKVPVFTAPQNQVHGLRAVNGKNIFGATYFPHDLNQTYAKYFTDTGFNVVAMKGLDLKGLPFGKIQDVPSSDVYDFIVAGFKQAKGADVIYMLGSAWETLDIVEKLEQTCGVPVIHPVIVRAWEIQKRLNMEKSVQGYGTLIAKLPACNCG